MSSVKTLILNNKCSTAIGFLAGGVITRFFEDGNLLVTTVFTGMTTMASLLIWLGIKKVFEFAREI